MKQAAAKIVLTFVAMVVLMMLDRLVFVIIYGGWPAMIHGYSLDMAAAGYLTLIPGLLAAAQSLWQKGWLRRIETVYYGIVSGLLAGVFLLDAVLYSYWDFRLDTTPFFYFATSPGAAMASAEWWMPVAGAVGWIVAGAGIYQALRLTAGRINVPRSGAKGAVTALLLTGLLFLPIRGGVTVSTTNLSRAYFSNDQRLNHAAVNPVFSLLYSAMHQSNFGEQYRFFGSDAEAYGRLPAATGEAVDTLTLNAGRPDVYIVIAESFSAHLLPSLGGEPIATGLDSIAREGALFTRFYANGFRTDRAIPSILSGFPAQPTSSVMKYADKAERLPGVARELKRQGGYEAAYYYGGDANFTNMKAYILSSGFDRLVSDVDFPVRQRLSKWGAHDDVLAARVLAELPAEGDAPRFTVVQTSSSHEPFKVPYANPRFADNERKNAFAFADSCITAMVNGIGQNGRKSLIFILGDHYAAWPPRDSLPEGAQRFHIPLVVTGSALNERGKRIDTPASQNDLAATLLGLLGMDNSAFALSHNALSGASPHFAWVAGPDMAGVITAEGEGYINVGGGELRDGRSELGEAAKAWLQIIYSELSRL